MITCDDDDVAKTKEDYVQYDYCEVDINKYNGCYMYMYKYMYKYNSWYNIALKFFMYHSSKNSALLIIQHPLPND